MTMPRYRQVADALIEEIRAGRWLVGELLPTEMDLCQRFAISRHTAREALRRLRDAGLVECRQGSGTRLASRSPRLSYQQRVGSVEDLLQYGSSTRLDVRSVERLPADAEHAEWLDVAMETPLLHLHGLRRERDSERVLCVTDVYLAADGNSERYGQQPGQALAAMLADLDVNRLGQVEQQFSALAMPARAARELGVKSGLPALAALRRYFDRSGRLTLVARSLHPGDSFSVSIAHDLQHDGRRR
jgi:DNA-binding GntR family transcriptional regulator